MLNKVTDRVYYMDYVQQGDRAVMGLIIGDKYSLVVDGGNSKEHAEEFLGYVKELNITNIKYLAITHWHWDHIFGANTINADINIVQEITNERLKWLKNLKWTDEAIDERVKSGEEIDFCREHIKIEMPNNDRKVEIPAVDIVFKDKLEIDLGNVLVSLIHIPCDHSEDCVVINIKSEGVTFLGDAVYLDMYNGEWSYSREKLFNLLDILKELNSNCYIPAHHPKYTKETFEEFYNYQKLLGNIVGEGISLEEAMERLKEKVNRDLKEEEIEDLKVFINNNKKK